MIKSLYSGMTGLKSYQTGIDVVANNISNVNTTAYKSKSAKFSNVLYQTLNEAGMADGNAASRNPKQVGLGSKVAAIKQNITTPGSVETTEYPWDMRISGETFFVVHDGQQNYYTKDGTFGIDANGDLVTRTGGLYVSGWMSEDGKSVDRSKDIGKIHLTGEKDPNEPTYVYIQGNVDGRDEKLNSTGDLVTIRIEGEDGQSYQLEFAFSKDHTDSGRTLQLDLQNVTDANGNSAAVPNNPSILLTYDADGKFLNANGSVTGKISLNLPDEIAGKNGVVLDVSDTTLVSRKEKPISISGGLPDWVSLDENSDKNGYMSSTYGTEDGVTHSSSVFDFSKFSSANKNSLINNGFYFTCCTCENYYSVEFVSGTESSMVQDGAYFIYKVGIDDVNSGEELVKKIMDVTEGNPNEHFTQLSARGSKLVIYDERPYPEYAGKQDFGLVGRGVANYNHQSASDTSLTSLYGDALGPAGKLLNYSTDRNGMIYAQYQGGRRLIGQIAVARFQNPSGLSSTGQNLFEESANSGRPEYMDVTEDEQGGIYAGELEMSNVQLADEFAQMIFMQRAFQTNSKVISTSDQMLGTLKDMKR